MNAKAVIPLVLAVVLGLVAALLVRNAMTHKSPVNQGNMVTVVVAKQSVDPGRQLSKEDLVVSQVPTDAAPGQVFSDPNQLVGRVVTTPLVKGQAILETLLAPAGTGSGLQSLIPPGMRTMTLEVNEYTGVGGMMAPGCHLDLMGIVKDPKTGESISRTILQNVKVEAIGHNVSATPPADGTPPPASNALTLLCTPHQAQIIQLALITSRPWFVMRSTKDGQELPLEGTTMAELRDGDNSDSYASVPPPPTDGTTATATPSVPDTTYIPSKRTIQIFRGGTESTVTITVAGSRGVTAGVDTAPVVPN